MIKCKIHSIIFLFLIIIVFVNVKIHLLTRCGFCTLKSTTPLNGTMYVVSCSNPQYAIHLGFLSLKRCFYYVYILLKTKFIKDNSLNYRFSQFTTNILPFSLEQAGALVLYFKYFVFFFFNNKPSFNILSEKIDSKDPAFSVLFRFMINGIM